MEEEDGRGGEGKRKEGEGERKGREGGLCSSNISLKTPAAYSAITENIVSQEDLDLSDETNRRRRQKFRHGASRCVLLIY